MKRKLDIVRERNTKSKTDSINNFHSDILGTILSFCQGSLANLTCKRWNQIYYKIYGKRVYNEEFVKNEKLMIWYMNLPERNDDEDEKLYLVQIVGLCSPVSILELLYKKKYFSHDTQAKDRNSLALTIINSMDLDKMIWYFLDEKITDIENDLMEIYLDFNSSVIPNVIDGERFDVFEFLRLNHFDFSYYDIELASALGKLGCLKYLLKYTDCDPRNSWIFSEAIKNKKWDIVKYLIETDYDIKTDFKEAGLTEIMASSGYLGKKPDMPIINYLIDHNALDIRWCIIGAATRNNVDLIYYLKQKYSLTNLAILDFLTIQVKEKHENNVEKIKQLFS